MPLSHAFLHSTKPVTGRFREVQPQYTLHSQRPFPVLHQGTLWTFTHAAFEESSASGPSSSPDMESECLHCAPLPPRVWGGKGLQHTQALASQGAERGPYMQQDDTLQLGTGIIPASGWSSSHSAHTLRRCPPRARRCPTRAVVRRLTLLHSRVLRSRSAHFPSRGTEQI